MKFTDSHCHLDFTEFNAQLPQLIAQCAQANIHQIIIPAISPDNWQKVIDLSLSHSTPRQENALNTDLLNKPCQLYPCLGIHPWFLKDLKQSHLDALASQVEKHHQRLVAIGETGVDGVIAKQQDNLNQQSEFFSYQLQLAKQYQLPVIVHHRQSHQTILPLLKQAKLGNGGVVHAFSGSYQQAKSYLDLGFKLGVGGAITYPRAIKTINAIKRLPLTSLVLETDAPAMPLFGFQGKMNSPMQLLNVFNQLVNLRSESAEQMSLQLEKNIRSLFQCIPIELSK